jgi:uncharacterized membrane protein YcaP (DUF421 family)
MFFRSWTDVLRVAAMSSACFVLVLIALRLTGQRALSKMSAYDMILTVTLGSIIASVALFRNLTLVDGLTALVTLIIMQEGIRLLQSRRKRVHHIVRSVPDVVLWDGKLLQDRLESVNISADEIRAAVRKAGLRSFSEVQLIVLENDGQWSVIPRSARAGDDSALHGLPIPRTISPTANTDDQDSAVPADPFRVP